MSKQRRLGRGLEALLGRTAQPQTQPAAAKPAEPIRPIDIISRQHSARNTPAVDQQRLGNEASGPSLGMTVHQNGQPAEQPTNLAQQTANPAEFGSADRASSDMHNAETPSKPATNNTNPDNHNTTADTDLVMVNVALIETNPFQPRKDFDDDSMAELSESISEHGLLQPIVARRVDDVYQLIAGERRLRAAQKAGWEEVPVRVIETDRRGVAELAIVENLQRKDLNALEKAASFRRYLQEHKCTQNELAARLKIDRSTVANFMRLLELPAVVQQAITEGKITQGHARAILPLGEDREQIAFCERIQREGLNVRQTETLVQEMIKAADAEPLALLGRDGRSSKATTANDHLASLEQEFRSGLGTKVKLTQGRGGRGKLVIHFKNHEEFNRVKQHILGPAQPQAKAG